MLSLGTVGIEHADVAENEEKRTQKVSLLLRPSLFRKIEQLAKDEDRSVNWICSQLIESGIKARLEDDEHRAKT